MSNVNVEKDDKKSKEESATHSAQQGCWHRNQETFRSEAGERMNFQSDVLC